MRPCFLPFPAPFILATLLALAFAGCARRTVRIPADDGTPPVSALDVVTAGGHLVMLGGDAPADLELAMGDSAILIGLGMDGDGGVKELSLSGNAVAICRSGNRDTVRKGSFARRYNLPGGPGGRAPGSRVTRLVLRASDFQKLCGLSELRSVSGAVGVRTVNYHGVSSTSPTLEFRVDGNPDSGQASTAARAAPIPQGPQQQIPIFGPLPAGDYQDAPRI